MTPDPEILLEVNGVPVLVQYEDGELVAPEGLEGIAAYTRSGGIPERVYADAPPCGPEAFVGDPVDSREEARRRLPTLSRHDLGTAFVHLAYAALQRSDADDPTDASFRARAYVALELGFQMRGAYVSRLKHVDPNWPPEEERTL